MTGRSRSGLLALFGVAILLATMVPLPIVEAASQAAVGATLPTGRTGTSAVWDGSGAYIFGGQTAEPGPSDQIVRYDPGTDAVAVMNGRLPSGRAFTSAVWDGKAAYIFGGEQRIGSGNETTWDDLDEILRYDPATDAVTVMSARLPTGRYATAAVWTGSHALVLGGETITTDADGTSRRYLNEIVRYDPATDTVETMSVTLPGPNWSDTSAVWDGSAAYVFGMGGDHSDRSDQNIARYDPATDTARVMGAVLPSRCDGTSAVWDGSAAYIFGCEAPGVFRFDPSVDAVTSPAVAPLAGFPYFTSAVWTGSSAYVFGLTRDSFSEMDPQPEDQDLIVRFTPDGSSGTSTTSPTPTGAPAESPAPPPPAVSDQTASIGASGSTTLRLSGEATLRIDGDDGTQLQIEATVATEAAELPDARPGLAGASLRSARYLQFESQTMAGSTSRFTITVDVPTDGGGELRAYYWTGAKWALAAPGTIEGEGEPDLEVFAVDVDRPSGVVRLTVDHLSSYAIAIHDEETDPSSGQISWIAVAGGALLLALLLVSTLLIGQRSRSRRGPRAPPPPAPPGKAASSPGRFLKCPKCGTSVALVPGEKPVCPKCWYGA